MIYDMVFDELAIDFLEKTPSSIRKRIYDKIMIATKDPKHFFIRLEGRTDYKLRVGDYRVIADITNERIEITHIGHAKKCL